MHTNSFAPISTALLGLVLLTSGACGSGSNSHLPDGGTGTAPTVLSASPTAGETAVPINAHISATFSEVMDPATITAATFTVTKAGTSVPGSVSYAYSTAVFTPTASLGTVLMEQMGNALERTGITAHSADDLERASKERHRQVVLAELEGQRALTRLRKELEEIGKIKQDSQRVMEFQPALLRDALDVGFELTGAGRLERMEVKDGDHRAEAWKIPALPDSWARTLDSLRQPRQRDETPWDWRKRPLLPVMFEAPARIDSEVAQLHLSHPVVQRVLQRFLAQGFSSSDLHRVTVVRSKRDSVARVVAFGRLSLLGAGAARLHDELVSVAARWIDGGGRGHLKPFADDADRKAIEQLEATLLVDAQCMHRHGPAEQAHLVGLTETAAVGGREVKGAIVKLPLAPRLDGQGVPQINSRLRGKPERPDPEALFANVGKSFQGSIVLGMGFVLTPERRAELIAKDKRNGDRIFRYIGGEEINSDPDPRLERYVINFGQMDLAEAEAWPDLIGIVRELVKPERDRNNREIRRRNWWLFGESAPALFEALRPLKRCLASSRHSKHLIFSFQGSEVVFSEATVIIPVAESRWQASLQSRVHEVWARLLSSSMRTDLRYAPSDCFETFPFPAEPAFACLDAIGENLDQTRRKYMESEHVGLTTTYNRLKDLSQTEPRLVALRALHEELDRQVLAAYGWGEVAVPPYCGATPKEMEAFEDEVLDRLFDLNAQRAQEEKRSGAGIGVKTKGKRKQKAS